VKSSFQNTISIDMALYLVRVCVSRKPKKEQKTLTAHTRSERLMYQSSIKGEKKTKF